MPVSSPTSTVSCSVPPRGAAGPARLNREGRAVVAALADPLARSTVVVAPPGSTPGSWAGAPSAVLVNGVFWLAYRLRRPTGQGRGYANVVARSDDGEHFETVAEVRRETFGAWGDCATGPSPT